MQQWFFVEDPKNALLRSAGEISERTEMAEEIAEEPMPRQWHFRVRVPTLKPEEVICLTGDLPELGNWMPEKCVVLKKIDGDVWSIDLNLPSNKKIHYRYFVGVIVEMNRHVIVRSWETSFHPRKIRVNEIQEQQQEEIFGIYNGATKIDKGWLIKGTIVQLMLCKQPFKLWRPRYENRKIYIKVTPVSIIKENTSSGLPPETPDESLSNDFLNDHPQYSYTDVASLRSKDPTYKPQKQFGNKFQADDLIIFQCYILNLANTALLIDVYVYSSKAIDDEPPYHAGFCYILPSLFQASTGSIILPLTSTKQRPLGELKLEYLLIEPLPTFKCDLRKTYSRYWKKTKRGLNVGHRGSGSSFKYQMEDSAEIRENTIASLKTAVMHGADYVEFDVQLSKDFVPVIYHDYHVCIAMRKKKTLMDGDMYEIPIKDLTLDQLRMLKLYNIMEGKTKNPRFFDEDLEEHQPFPTLKSALELLDSKCGFNIEIKWTNKYADGTFELNDAIDINRFVDTILDVVLNYAGDRPIIFSSFNPDICTLIRFKQNKYPAMFLTQGETVKYPQYDDPRCWTTTAAIEFVNMIEILGICAHTEDILRDPSLVHKGLEAGLVTFCWGDDIADPDTIQYLKELGLHGIIYDKIYQYMASKDKESIYLLDARESQKDIIRMVAQSTEAAAVSPSPSEIAKTTEKLLQDKMDAECDHISTATSLASLESGVDSLGKMEI
ncbi:hypothetical protein AMK59_6947 [Oryctes borbonicus]|uniref:GP-PDE domain-containing protein n=1 Tax=Oryctes borbonicus TaxID=1629725 RepID=A0A0T6AW17_9SCAR|nr:hypothetical protein AMK59_6947 [Oryctes borbonicus]